MKQRHSFKPPGLQLAIALKHEFGQSEAPMVVAKGQGLAARKILELAEENEIPIHHDEGLSQVLSEVEVEETIPAELYEAVAQVLAFIYRADRGAAQQ